MKRIDEIDYRFKVETKIDKDDIKFHSILDCPFEINGVFYENDRFRRLPRDVAFSTSEWVGYLSGNTSGGRIRFKTDSEYVAIHAKMDNIGKMDHFALTGSAGFDMYVLAEGEYKYNNTFRPPFEIADGYESLFDFKSTKMREIVINMPLYSDVKEFYIGLKDGAAILEPTPYKHEKPVVFYGHSITQGACATRPGNTYPSILSRKYGFDFINLGFSGSARGEDAMAEYIASLDMGAFVYDYDHNAPNAEHLLKTHEKMFKTIRKAHPSMPIVIMSTTTNEPFINEVALRREVIYKTYENALASGDTNVYFLDGRESFAPYDNFGTVEGCHPNDLGLFGIAKSLEGIFDKILKR